jgi:phosphatidylglycerophosphate synthase
MLDRYVLDRLRRPLAAVATRLAAHGVRADTLTWLGFGVGLAAAVAIVAGAFLAGAALILASRALDGLDGALARATRPTDGGAFLDIALDMLFYASVPLAFAIHDPAANALPAAVLLAAFVGTGTSFLAFAVMAERRGLVSPKGRPEGDLRPQAEGIPVHTRLPQKGFHFLGGLTEGTETIAVLVAMCLWPAAFPWLASGFAAACAFTIATRVHAGRRAFADPADPPRRTREGSP